MMRQAVLERIARGLADEPGWDRLAGPQRFRHAATGVYIVVYGSEVAVVFGRDEVLRQEKAVCAKLAYYPGLAIASALEVARALVAQRLAAAADIAAEP